MKTILTFNAIARMLIVCVLLVSASLRAAPGPLKGDSGFSSIFPVPGTASHSTTIASDNSDNSVDIDNIDNIDLPLDKSTNEPLADLIDCSDDCENDDGLIECDQYTRHPELTCSVPSDITDLDHYIKLFFGRLPTGPDSPPPKS